MVAGVGNHCRLGRTRGVRSFMIFSVAVLLSLVFLSLLRGLGNDAVVSFLVGSCDAGSVTVLDDESSLSPEWFSL